MSTLDPWFRAHLVCPVDLGPLAFSGSDLQCQAGHSYPVVDGTPVMLVPGASETIGLERASLARATRTDAGDPRAPELYLESLGINDEEKKALLSLPRDGAVDPVVAFLIAATNGLMYRHLIGSIDRYPIPELPLPAGDGRTLLDIGCSWGRWSLAAAAGGYAVIGIDPSLGAVMAARRVARQLGLSPRYLVGDGRQLPFAAGTFASVYSYSVLQHFSEADAARCAGEIGRVLANGGTMKVQMPSRFGIRCLYHQARRRFRAATGFEVRYWGLDALRRLFEPRVGPVTFLADCYFGIGLQSSDAQLMTPSLKLVLGASNAMKRVSRTMPVLTRVADSVFVEATKAPRAMKGHDTCTREGNA